MEIRHTHPQTKSPEEREAQLKDVRRSCLTLIRARRKQPFGKESA